MQVPRVEKIVVSMGVGAAITTGSLLDNAQRDMTVDHRPKAHRDPREEIDRRLQAA